MSLQDVIENLSQNYMQVKIITGYADAIDGYGWHTKYYVQVFKTNEYCEICKTKQGINVTDDAHMGNHRWRHETECIYDKIHYHMNSIIADLNKIAL